MAGRPGLTQAQRDQLDATMRSTGNASAAARAAGVSTDAAHRYFKKRAQSGTIRGPTPAEQRDQIVRDIERITRELERIIRSLRIAI